MAGSLAIGLGYMGQPHLVLRFMAISSPDDVRKGRLIAIGWALIAFFGAILIGVTGLAFFGPEAMGAGGLPFCSACQDVIGKVIEYYSH